METPIPGLFGPAKKKQAFIDPEPVSPTKSPTKQIKPIEPVKTGNLTSREGGGAGGAGEMKKNGFLSDRGGSKTVVGFGMVKKKRKRVRKQPTDSGLGQIDKGTGYVGYADWDGELDVDKVSEM